MVVQKEHRLPSCQTDLSLKKNTQRIIVRPVCRAVVCSSYIEQ